MTDAHPTLVSRTTMFEGKVFKTTRDRVRLPHGREVQLDIIRHGPSVILLPLPAPARVVLVRQYRYAIDRWIWELPAGSVDPGEEPERAAVRECHEEIGRVPDTVERLAELYPTPGYSDELMIFFRLTGLRPPARSAIPDDDEMLQPHEMSLADARAMVARGEIQDMKTVVGLRLIE